VRITLIAGMRPLHLALASLALCLAFGLSCDDKSDRSEGPDCSCNCGCVEANGRIVDTGGPASIADCTLDGCKAYCVSTRQGTSAATGGHRNCCMNPAAVDTGAPACRYTGTSAGTRQGP